MKRAIWAGVIAIPVVILLASGFGRDPNAIASPLLNKPAPTFALHTAAGKSVSLASLRGKVVVLNFWASWCAACAGEHRVLTQGWRHFNREGVQFIGVDYQEELWEARPFLRRYGSDWPSVADPGSRTAINYGVYGVPETYLVDRAGVVRYKSTGLVTSQILTQQLDRLLEEKR